MQGYSSGSLFHKQYKNSGSVYSLFSHTVPWTVVSTGLYEAEGERSTGLYTPHGWGTGFSLQLTAEGVTIMPQIWDCEYVAEFYVI